MYEYYNPYAINNFGNDFISRTPINNGYPNMSFQRNSQPVQQNQNADNQAIFYYVPNKAVVDNWLLGKDQKAYFMESNAPIMYLKATDKDGKYYPLRTFDIVERKVPVQGPNEAPSIDTTSFVKRDEITALVAKAVEEYLNAPAKKEA